MIFIVALMLGVSFASSGLVAKQINSGFGAQIANRCIHKYLTWLGTLSNLVLPLIVVVIASVVRGVEGGLSVVLGLIIGALALGAMSLHYPFKLLLAVFGVPLASVFLLICLF